MSILLIFVSMYKGLVCHKPLFSLTRTHTHSHTHPSSIFLSHALFLSLPSYALLSFSPLHPHTLLGSLLSLVQHPILFLSSPMQVSEWPMGIKWGEVIRLKMKKTRPYFLQPTTLLSRRREGVPISQFKHACLFCLFWSGIWGKRCVRWSGCYPPKRMAQSIGFCVSISYVSSTSYCSGISNWHLIVRLFLSSESGLTLLMYVCMYVCMQKCWECTYTHACLRSRTKNISTDNDKCPAWDPLDVE